MYKGLIVVFLAAGVVAAQDPPTRAGRLSYLSGTVSFEPAGVTDWAPASLNRPLTIGDQLYVDQGGKAEVHVPGAAFRLGNKTAFEFLNLDDRTVQVRLSEGTLDVRVRRMDGALEIDGPNFAFTPSRPGEYRMETNPDTMQSYVTVRDGEGQVTGTGGAFTIKMGQQAAIVGQDQAAQYKIYGAPGSDSFDEWVVSRSHREDRYASSRYVSPDLVGGEDLGAYGSWRQTPDYGQVWVPNDTPSGWAPYQAGQWSWVEPWGWTWVDNEPWGYAPFHYGRWAFVNGYWGWCPGPVAVAPVFAPALVAWVGFGGGLGVNIGFGGGVGFGWFPLGPRDVYIPSFAASAAYVNRINVTNTTIINQTNVTNVYNNYVRTGSVPVGSYMNRTVPGAVAAVSQSTLTSGQPLQHSIVHVQPNQMAAVKTAEVAPRVAPQMSSVLGHAPSANVAHPPAAVLSHPMVARTTPPPPAASFQQRQAALEKTPGRPLPVSQLNQMARTAPAAARPPVRVVSQARPIAPQTVAGSAPKGQPAAAPARNAPAPAPERAAQPPAQPATRPYEPPPAERAHSQPMQPAPAARQPAPAAKQTAPPSRPFEPPSASERAAQPAAKPAQLGQRFGTAPPTQHANATPPRSVPQPHVAQPRPVPQPQHAAPPQKHAVVQPPRATPQPRPAPQPQHAAPPPRPAPQQNAAARPAPQPQHAAPPPRPAPQQHAAPPPRPAPQQHAAPPERKEPERH